MLGHLCPMKDYLKNPAIYHAGLNTGGCKEKIYTKDASKGKKKQIFICSEIQLLRNRVCGEKGENISLGQGRDSD